MSRQRKPITDLVGLEVAHEVTVAFTLSFVQVAEDEEAGAGGALAGMSLEEQRTAAQAIRRELGLAEDDAATEVRPAYASKFLTALKNPPGGFCT